jgi:RHS repeat-associated protein
MRSPAPSSPNTSTSATRLLRPRKTARSSFTTTTISAGSTSSPISMAWLPSSSSTIHGVRSAGQKAGGEGIIRFTGQKLDVESGLLYYGGRYYDPELGRFISPDPYVQEIFDPQSLNRYSYVVNNPQNYVDPSGYFHRHKVKKSNGFFGTIFDAIIGFILGGPAGALFGAALAQLPPEVFHGLEIFGGIAMLLTGNPAGIAFIAQGALGFCKEQSCQYASAGFGLVGGAALGAPSGGEGFSEAGGAGGFGNDFPVPESPSLGGMGGQALISVAKTIDNQ